MAWEEADDAAACRQQAVLSRGLASGAQSGECKAFGFGKESQGSFSSAEFVRLVVFTIIHTVDSQLTDCRLQLHLQCMVR